MESGFSNGSNGNNNGAIAMASVDPGLVACVNGAASRMGWPAVQVVGTTFQEACTQAASLAPRVFIADIGPGNPEDLNALASLAAQRQQDTAIIVCTETLDPQMARTFIHLRIADLLLKPCEPGDIRKALKNATEARPGEEVTDAKIYTFQPVAGGVGNTVIALQAASLLRKKGRTCVVDLNLQQGSCAEYLDLEPRFHLDEVGQDPERLDKQLLEAMLSHHESGLVVLAAPPDPAAITSFNANLVTRTLDLAATSFDNVIIDMPRTWFPWTDSVMLGTDHLYLVCELTAPCIRQAQRMLQCIASRSDNQSSPRIIVNRVDNRKSVGCLQAEDAAVVFKDAYAGSISNMYKAVREAIDRGVLIETIDAKNSMLSDLQTIILPEEQPAHRRSLMSFLQPRRALQMAATSA